MNEILMNRECKKIMRYGISKRVAKETVEVAMSISSKDLGSAIAYALTLQFGTSFSKSKC